MFKSITLENFFSFGKSTKIELNPDVNILVGINGSGKSNFIRAIQLLYEGVAGEGLEKLILRDWGGLSYIAGLHQSDPMAIQVCYSFQLSDQLLQSGFHSEPTYSIRFEKSNDGYFSLEERIFASNPEGEIEYLSRENGTISMEGQTQITPKMQLSLFEKRNYLTEEVSALQAEIDRGISSYRYFDTSESGKIRQLSDYYLEKKLLGNGNNLTMLLNFISANHPKAFDMIIEQVKNVNPHFKDLVFPVPVSGKTLLTLKEKGLERTIPIQFVSDGTLRFILLLSILYNPNRGSVVCLDEPEMGLHPDMIASVADGIKYAARNGTQMIVSTHSPLLLNDFDLEDILIFEKDAENQTIVKRKTEEDFSDWKGEFLAGQMWVMGQLGGTRW